MQVGDLVLAIGDPFNVGQTVTMGIVSALARTQISASDYQFFIQTDAAINPGNSGGALVTTDGKLAGINTAIYSRSGGSIGIGFAIPANLARRVVEGVEGGQERYTGQPASGLGRRQRPAGHQRHRIVAGPAAARRRADQGCLSRRPAGPRRREIGRGGAIGGRRGGGRHAVAELPHRHPPAGRQRENACRRRQERRAT